MPKPYPIEFRLDVVRVAQSREPGVTLEQTAADFGVHPMTLFTWLSRADVEDGVKPGVTSQQSAELREANKRNRLLEQEAEVLRRALAYVSHPEGPAEQMRKQRGAALTAAHEDDVEFGYRCRRTS